MAEGSRILLYMDILGTKEKTDTEGSESIKNLIDKFTSKAQEGEIIYNKPYDFLTTIDPKPTISNFSDHILISFPWMDSHECHNPLLGSPEDFKVTLLCLLIHESIKLQGLCLKEGFLMRGVITQGDLFHKGNSVLGKALHEAINLEEKTAVYPRVIISSKVTAGLTNNIAGRFLERDIDGVYFVNYLKSFPLLGIDSDFVTTRDIIEKNLKKFNDKLHQLAKWQWLAIKFNGALDYFIETVKFGKKEAAEKISKFIL